MEKKNRIAVIIKYLGWLVIVVGVAIMIYMNLPVEKSVGFYGPKTMEYVSPPKEVRIMSLYVLTGAFISGITWLGFSEIINLLDKILKKE